jgi:hypothetical protein
MTVLKEASLDFAKAHIEAYYDSDFFPKRDEYVAIWASWNEVKKYLLSLNVEKMPIEPPRSMPAPKARGGYRIVHQLEPLNALTYTALAHMVGPYVEGSRADKTVAFSYRLAISSDGFFSAGNGYRAFVDRCRELAASHMFVLSTDIADFYNRLYLHRLENSLSMAGCPPAVGKTLESFLLALNGKASQGIPVGPASSILMAEAVMTDVDQFLSNKAFPHARYVDDFRVFSDSKEKLEILLEELVQHLFDAHRLQLVPWKTRITEAVAFVGHVGAPEEDERRELLDLVRAVCEYGDKYTPSDIETLSKKYLEPTGPRSPRAASGVWGRFFQSLERHEQDERKTIRNELLKELLMDGLRRSAIDVGVVRHALRQGRHWGVADLVGIVLDNIALLEPVLPDAFLYLNAVCSDEIINEHIGALRALVSSPTFIRSRFARHWTYWLLASRGRLVTDRTLGRGIWNDAPIEWQLRAARTVRNLAKVRQYKAAIGDLGMWDRRSVLMASEVMPSVERGAWLGSVSTRDVVEESIVRWAREQP